MVVVADASVAIRGDLSGFHQDLNRAKADTGTLGQKLNEALSFKNILRTGAIFGLGTTLPGLLRDAMGLATEAASNFRELEQTGRTIDSVFGDSASTIEDWADRAAEAAGMSKREVQASAAQMGSTLINMGVDAETAADLVVRSQQRAADLAVAFGRDTGDALLGLSALLRGEFDTIEKFGVRIKQVDVNARIAALGLDVSTDAAKRQSEAIATMSLFMEQTEPIMGRFADGAEDTAIKMEIAGARWENAVDNIIGPFANERLDDAADLFENTGEEVDALADIMDHWFGIFEPSNTRKVEELARVLGINFNEALQLTQNALLDTEGTTTETLDGMLASAYELAAGGAESFDHFTAAFTTMGQSVQGVASGVGDVVAFAIPAAVLAHWDSIRQAGVDTMTAYNQGIFESQSSFISEIDNLLRLLDENLAPGEEIALLRGKKVELMYARGIASAKGDLGAVAAIDAMLADINSRLNTLNGYNAGRNLVITLANGIRHNLGTASLAAAALAGVIRRPVFIESEPKDRNSPLRGITKIGGNIVKTIAEGIYGELGTGEAASRALAGALSPSLGGMASSSGSAPTVIGAGGNTYILNVNGTQYVAKSSEEAIDILTGLGVFGDGRTQ